MNTPVLISPAEDTLFDLERKIARRADELVRLAGKDRNQALSHWLQAESEVWREVQRQAVAAE